MAWWDYGYQITAIANRTTIADGNTWNHEHIALLGRALTSPLKDGHRIARHLADYVLLWTGGGGDDVAKSPHLARIANSVYRNMVSILLNVTNLDNFLAGNLMFVCFFIFSVQVTQHAQAGRLQRCNRVFSTNFIVMV